MPIRTLVGLILCNLVWAAHPLMGKLVLESFPAPQVAWLRYVSGFFAFLVVAVALRGRTGGPPGPVFFRPRNARDAWVLIALGLSAFCLSPLLQLTGLNTSRAADNALIVAMEPLLTVFLAWLLLGQRPGTRQLVAFGVALAGFGLLTGAGGGWGAGSEPRWGANLLIFVSLFGEALYSSLGSKLVDRHSPAQVCASALAIGVIGLTIATALGPGIPHWRQIHEMKYLSLLGLLWLGPLGTALAYLFWMSALRHASVASISLTLFIQPIFGPILGMVFLGERLTGMQWIGSALILAAILAQAQGHLAERARFNPQ